MAKVTTKHAAVTFVLELTEAEAQYVVAALYRTNPTFVGFDAGFEDSVYGALLDAGVVLDPEAAELNGY